MMKLSREEGSAGRWFPVSRFLSFNRVHNWNTQHPKRSAACTPASYGIITSRNWAGPNVCVTGDVPSGSFLCGHAGWEVLLPCKPLASDSQTGGKLSPQAIFEQGVMEKEWIRQWTTPAERVLKIPHLKVMCVWCRAAAVSLGVLTSQRFISSCFYTMIISFYSCFLNIWLLHLLSAV